MNLLRVINEMEEEEMTLYTKRRIYQRADPLNYFSDDEFKLRFRLNKESAVAVVGLLENELEHSSNR